MPWLIVRYVRHRWPALVPIALVVALGACGALVALGAAERTASAYARYLERSAAGDVVVNPSLATSEIDAVVRDLPGVRAVTSDSLFLAAIDDRAGAPRTGAELAGQGYVAQVLGSADGRYSTMDRPVVTAGRLPSAGDEVLVNRALADARKLEVGDLLTLSFWDPADELRAEPDDVVSPVGVEQVRVAGVATLADEVFPDRLYPAGRIIVSPELAARYDCLPDVPMADATEEEVLEAMFPLGCASIYRYYSLDLDAGSRAVPAAVGAFLDRSVELNAELPPGLLAQEASYFLIATTTSEERQRVERSTYPTVVALVVLGAAAAATTVVVTALAVARELRRAEDDLRQWRSMGLTTRSRAAVVTIPLLASATAGLAVALVAAWVLSPVGPAGVVRAVDPGRGRGLGPGVALAAAALALLGAIGLPALALRAIRRARRVSVPRREIAAVRRLVRLSARPEVGEGARAAYSGAGAGLVVATCSLAAGALVAAVVFGASLSALVSTPATYGWPWDVGVMTGFGYGDLDLEAVNRTMGGQPDVESWSVLGFSSDITLDDEPVLAVVGLDTRDDVDFTVVSGRLPRAPDELAVGGRTAAERGLAVGDEVEVAGEGLPTRRSTVTGIAVLPPLGPFQADRTGPGTGIVLPASVAPPELVADNVTFVGVDLAPGVEADAFFRERGDSVASWDVAGSPPVEYATPVRPDEIVDAEAMRNVPLVVGGLLAASALVGLGVAVALSVRARRRELAILRSLGFTGRQLRTTVRAQAMATMAAALVVGAPLGVAAGRFSWRSFASVLGVVTDPVMPLRWLAATVAGALVVALAAAALPARRAARTEPVHGLRAE